MAKATRRTKPKIGDASTNELLSETLRLMRAFENQAEQQHIPEMRKAAEYLEMMLRRLRLELQEIEASELARSSQDMA